MSDRETVGPVASDPNSWRGEILRWLVLLACGCWLFHPFATSRMIGAGDAVWYSNMLADFVLQWRAGVFPVFVGQTEYAFNGAIYPLRVAPLYQHWAGLVDLLTGRQLSFITLQHLVAISAGVTALVGAYVCLASVLRGLRWAAVALSILYVSCPAILALLYTQDLYMSWMAMPFLPLVVYGMTRTFFRDDALAWTTLAAGLALLWLAHAPIAFWMTAIVGVVQLGRLTLHDRSRTAWARAGAGAVLLLLLGSYPFVSVRSLRSDTVPPPATSARLERTELIVQHLRTAFPGSLRPLSSEAGQLSDVQLGYGLFFALLTGATAYAVKRSWQLGALVLSACALLLLLLPIPGWSETLWLTLMPEPVRRLTYYWPMQRLYPLIAALAAFAGALAWHSLPANHRLRQAGVGVLMLCAAWSLFEARQFVRAGKTRTLPQSTSEQLHRSENVMLMNHAYGFFSKLPSTFSHGVMDPFREVRLLHAQTKQPLAIDGISAKTLSTGELTGKLDANPGIVNLSPAFPLQPGKRYDLAIHFRDRAYEGVLQLVGENLFRLYGLPSSGEPLGFGSVRQNSPILPLWTTSERGETVHLRFIPTAAGSNARDFLEFGSFQFSERIPNTSPVRIVSLLPYEAQVSIEDAMLLETSRMFVPGYEAKVNGAPAETGASPDARLTIAVPAGSSRVTLEYTGPFLLRTSYWTTVAGWLALLFFILRTSALRVSRSLRPAKPPILRQSMENIR